MINPSKRILFIGAGQIASSVATQLAPNGFTCFGYSRSPRLRERHIRWVSSTDLASLEAIQTVVFTLTPSDRSPGTYKRDYLDSLVYWMAAPPVIKAQQVLWISSTRVYGEDAGQLVDQHCTPRPKDIQGRLLLTCEQRITEVLPRSSLVIRFPGLYGNLSSFRHLTARLQHNRVAQQWPPRWQNRLHREDASNLITHCISQNITGSNPLLACDLSPSTEWETASWLASQLGITLGRKQKALNRGKRIVSNLDSISGYRVQVPNWRTGYKRLLTSLDQRDQQP